MELPETLKYTDAHEWVADNGDGTVTVGITAVATDQLGDLVYIELPEVGANVARGSDCAVVESTKTAADVYAPVSGVVIAVNAEVTDHPERVNESPYGGGWLFKLKLTDTSELASLLTRDDYAKSAGV